MALYNFTTQKIFETYPDIHNFQDNDIAIIEETNEAYKYKNNKWIKQKKGLEVSLLELNKSIVGQLPTYNEEQVAKLKFDIQKLKARYNEKYYILISYENYYLTVFANTLEESVERFEDIVLACARARGRIKTHEDEVDHIDIWVKQEDNEVVVLHLLPYSAAVEEY